MIKKVESLKKGKTINKKTSDWRTLYVLGAGASIGASKFPILNSIDEMRNSMPSAENFFYDLFKVKTKKKDRDFFNIMSVMYPGLHDFLLQSWGFRTDEQYDPKRWKGVNIEEVLSFFDVGSKMASKNSKERKIFTRAKNSLISFLAPQLTSKCNGQHCEHLQSVFFSLKKKDSVISYNWDTLADHTLDLINAPQIKAYAEILRDDSFNLEKYKNRGLFLKLHGSLNWRSCSDSKCSNYKKLIPPFKKNSYKLLEIEQTYNCPICGNGKPISMIIPPISDKLIHKNSDIHRQWLLARECLLYVEKVVFIGYSFPPSDFYSEWLFRQLNFIVGKERPEIVVVNPEYKNKKSAVFQRYNKIFRDYQISSWSTLEEFTENINKIPPPKH